MIDKGLSALLRQQTGVGKRSDALKPLAWLIGLLVTLLIGLTFNKADTKIIWFVSAILAAAIIFYGFAYTFLLVRNPDALRSEQFAIQKLALEQGIYGDNLVGEISPKGRKANIIDVSSDEQPPASVIEDSET